MSTALALLAFLGDGWSQYSLDELDGTKPGQVVRRALTWLMRRQELDGCLGDGNGDARVRSHLAATLALAEAQGMTWSFLLLPELRSAVTSAVEPRWADRSWAWGAMLVRALDATVERLAPDVWRRLCAASAGRGDAVELLMRCGMLARDGREEMTPVAKQLALAPLGDAEERMIAGFAMHQFDGARSDRWMAWFATLSDGMLSSQRAGAAGVRDSWDSTKEGDRVATTALNAPSLEVHTRYNSRWGK